jgi:hypothetical protein
MTKFRTMTLLTFALLLTLSGSGYSGQQPRRQLEENGRESLRGLSGVFVRVSICPDDDFARSSGGLWSCEQIKTWIELRLRQSGITVVSSEKDTRPGFGILNVAVGTMADVAARSRTGETLADIFIIHCRLIQGVRLSRNPDQFVSATTWSMRETGFLGRARSAALKDYVLGEIDEFINDFLATNPKR